MRLALAIAIAATALGQQPSPPAPASIPPPASAPADKLPSYYVGFGATYGFFGGRGFSSSTELALRVGTTQCYSYTDLESAPRRPSQVAQGGACVAKASGNWLLVAVGAAGLTGPSFTAGGEILYDLGYKLSGGKQHLYLGLIARPLTVSGAGTKPVYGFTLGTGL
jgi:hypothetical protein